MKGICRAISDCFMGIIDGTGEYWERVRKEEGYVSLNKRERERESDFRRVTFFWL